MLKLQYNKEPKICDKKFDGEDLRFLLYEGAEIGRFFTCRCKHNLINHKNYHGECLVPNCSLMCFCFVPKVVTIKCKSEFIKNSISLNGFEEFLRLKMIPVPNRKTSIFWKMWEKHLGVFK